MTPVLAALFLLLLVGAPIGVAFGLVILLNTETFDLWLDSLGSVPYDAVSSFPLLAIPLFLLVGEVMNRGGLAERLTALCDAALRRLPARLGHVAIAASALMGAITGSSVATVAAIGSTVGPAMRRRGYARGYIASLVAAAGLLGVLIPPSIPLILYGSIVGVSITELFLATLVPGLVMTLAYFATHALRARHGLAGGREEQDVADEPVVRQAAPGARTVTALFLPVLVLGGIYSGIFTPTEAAAVAGLYTLVVTLVHRTLRFAELPDVFLSTAKTAAAILTIIAFTSLFNRALVLAEIPQDIAAFAIGITDSPAVFLITVNLVLIVVGMFMETNAAVLLMGPLLAPAAIRFGIDPVHFAIVLVTNIEMGLLTPPLAANLYVAARTARATLMEMMPHFYWFLLTTLVVLGGITFIPSLSLWYRFL
ncbi:TRAP transporter large permease [Arenibaculum pallidiluteum]|uniref:TRAP transporter large permease n=1 Tax=Arenibaculum pallidiluteum TaxID=2812559 RepID=UPI001A95DE08|nr:TRAP transporter large permease [Arenibaculum pallidiluteum]